MAGVSAPRILGLAAAVLLVACSGAAAPPASQGPGLSQPATTSVAPPVSAAPAPAATQTAGGGGGYEGPPCALLTPEDVASVLGGGGFSLVAQEIRPGITLCSWLASDLSNVAAYSLLNRGNTPVNWADYSGLAGATDVPGLGDRALFYPIGMEIFVQKGGTVFGVGAGKGDHTPDQRKAWEIELARLILGRL